MLPKQEVVAMLLAGGRGSRLYSLTKNVAKPAVPFGGKYRIIDFPLSNCVNSGISTVGVLTQYQPLELNEYIGNGQPWDLDSMNGGVRVLPPYEQQQGTDWYKGTANAIYQNLGYIARYNPEYVIVLSGDHIYKMDYSKMVEYHKANNAACTIACYTVSLEDASRYGILNTNEDGSIYEFDEKPKHPKSTNASMGIYCFTWEKLRKYLEFDEADPNSKNDFGFNVLPNMLNSGERMFAYTFDGYWKDVGTIDALWEANLDLLNPNLNLKLDDNEWKIYSRTPDMPPHYVANGTSVQNSLVAEGCQIYGDLEYSVLSQGVYVASGAKIDNSVILPGAVIEEGAVVQYALVAQNAHIGKGAVVGERPENMANLDDWGVAVVGPEATVADAQVVAPKEMIEA